MLKRKLMLHTMIFGDVRIREIYLEEDAARAKGYCYDAHAYVTNEFGGTEPVHFKVLARAKGKNKWEFCAVRKQSRK